MVPLLVVQAQLPLQEQFETCSTAGGPATDIAVAELGRIMDVTASAIVTAARARTMDLSMGAP